MAVRIQATDLISYSAAEVPTTPPAFNLLTEYVVRVPVPDPVPSGSLFWEMTVTSWEVDDPSFVPHTDSCTMDGTLASSSLYSSSAAGQTYTLRVPAVGLSPGDADVTVSFLSDEQTFIDTRWVVQQWPTPWGGDTPDWLFGGTLPAAYDLDFWLTSPATTRPYLRQRQSPRANPRVSLNRPTLKQRQYIP